MIGRWFRRARPNSGVGTAPSRAVCLPTHDLLAPALDGLAAVYAADPDTVGAVLRQHASRVLDADLCAVDEGAPDWQRAMAAEQAQATRAALLGLAGHPARLDLLMTPAAAEQLAADLTHAADTARQMNGDPA